VSRHTMHGGLWRDCIPHDVLRRVYMAARTAIALLFPPIDTSASLACLPCGFSQRSR
jgi:hypothetical protein